MDRRRADEARKGAFGKGTLDRPHYLEKLILSAEFPAVASVATSKGVAKPDLSELLAWELSRETHSLPMQTPPSRAVWKTALDVMPTANLHMVPG